MKKRPNIHPSFLFAITLVILTVACSTEKNTSMSRWWHGFNARYNTYYNGSVAYIEGSLEKEQGNQDNYTELLPLYVVGNKSSKEIGKSNFDKAIEKSEKAIQLHSIKKRPEWTKKRRKTAADIEWLNRREYNPFLWKAWMLMGRSQFHQGAFEEAASTFAYMSRLYRTQPAIYGKAQAWLAKAYIENNWLYDAEDVIRNMKRDTLDWRAVKEWDYTMADYYLHTQQYKEAIVALQRVIKHEKRKKQKAREYYLLGQLYQLTNQSDLAYKAYKKVVRMNPPYVLEFNARIAMTEVMAGTQGKKMIAKLKRMAASDKNKDYLDRVYYALGNIELARRDTAKAIAAYEKGREKSQLGGFAKGMLLLKLGDLYWIKQQWDGAQRCYGEAIGLLDKDRKDYEQLSARSKILDELVPYTNEVHLQDSLQQLAKMDEKERNAAIDRVIEELIKKEKEEKRAQEEANAAQTMTQQGGRGNTSSRPILPTNSQPGGNTWYFYNPPAVSQGKATFEKLWGRRENVDNWQRNNKTVVSSATPTGDQENTGLANTGTTADNDSTDIAVENADSAQADPHQRAYYLAQIPFTEEQLKASNEKLSEGLFQAGVIFKDKLDMLNPSEKMLLRLTGNFPEYAKMPDAYYHLFLLYARKGEMGVADSYIEKLKQHYPDNAFTKILTDPYFEENAKRGKEIEDSLYASTYDAFKAGRIHETKVNAALSAKRFPLGANRDKFVFIEGLNALNDGNTEACIKSMQTIIDKYPTSGVATIAGMIINGVKAGRSLRGGKFDMTNMWDRRSEMLDKTDSTAVKDFSNERLTDFVFIYAYPVDSVDENKLLFALAKYNFTNYLVRNFDINISEDNGLRRMMVSGFVNFDEALQYARQLQQQTTIKPLVAKCRPIIISTENLKLLGRTHSYDDYDKFYLKHFAPLKVSTFELLTQPTEIVTTPAEDIPVTPKQVDDALDDGFVIDTDEKQGDNPNEDTIVIPMDTPQKDVNNGNDTDIIIDTAPQQQSKEVPQNNGEIVIPVTPEPSSNPPAPALPTKSKDNNTGKQENAKQKTTPKTTKTAPAAKSQGKTTTPQTPQKKERTFDVDDEYYDLEGF